MSTEEDFEHRFPVGSEFLHCGRRCIVMRYVDEGEAIHTGRELGLHYEYTDDHGVIRSGVIAPREYEALEAENQPSPRGKAESAYLLECFSGGTFYVPIHDLAELKEWRKKNAPMDGVLWTRKGHLVDETSLTESEASGS